jgi:hypothetical protein
MWKFEYLIAIPLLFAVAWTLSIMVWSVLAVLWTWVLFLL